MNYSILFPKDDQYQSDQNRTIIEKPYFKDLGLDLIFNSLIESKKEFGLDQYYYEPLKDSETIFYRQEVMRELENAEIRTIMTDFSSEVYAIRHKMNDVRKGLEDEWSNNYLTRGHMLDHAERYCHAITKLKEEISTLTLHSEGLLGLVGYIKAYVNRQDYQTLSSTVDHLRAEFSTIEYAMLLKDGTIKVRKYEGQIDYAKDILATFEKFSQHEAKDYRHDLSEEPKADHIEAAVLNLLSDVYKDPFNDLANFSSECIRFDDEIIIQFSKEIQFYLSWLNYVQPLRDKGFTFNYPKMNQTSEHLFGYDCFDLALATKIKDKTVTNNFTIKSPESILVVTGPNQGGKTTYARMFGQMNYLASLGLCVPGKSASLYVFDNLYTHFGREEDLSTHDGKLKDDLERLYKITTKATSKSLIIINEIFSSTTLEDAIFLGNRMVERLVALKAPTVIVTFIDELALYSEATVSMMSTVKDNDPMKKTYKIVRKAPDGTAYAIHIANKYGLTYEKLCRRLNQ